MQQKLRIAVLLLSALLLPSGCALDVPATSPRPEERQLPIAARPQVPTLTIEQLRTTDYETGIADFFTVWREHMDFAFGDLDGDGIEDAAVSLALIDGNAVHRYLAAVLNKDGAPVHVASVSLGLRIGVDALSIEDGIVTAQTVRHAPDDPTCCPTRKVAAAFRLTDHAWQLLSETPQGRLTAQEIDERYSVAPTPTPLPATFNAAQVEMLFRDPEIVASHVLAQQFGHSGLSPTVRFWVGHLRQFIVAMPYIYGMHVWATGGPESGHLLHDVEQFAVAYLNSPGHYGEVAQQWLDALSADPCSAPAAARDWVIAIETNEPGVLSASIVLSLHSASVGEPIARMILTSANGDPDAIARKYGCERSGT